MYKGPGTITTNPNNITEKKALIYSETELAD